MWHCLCVARASVGSDIEALRQRLRPATLSEALLAPGAEVVLRSGVRRVTSDELRLEAGEVAGGLSGHALRVQVSVSMGRIGAVARDTINAP